MTEVVRVAPAALRPQREAYLDRLCEPQELFLELLIEAAPTWVLLAEDAPVGHAIVARDGTLLELSLVDAVLPRREDLFRLVVRECGVRGAYCKSFDHLLVTLGLAHATATRIDGTLFRDLTDTRGPAPRPGLGERLATPADIASIVPIRAGLFDHDDEVAAMVAKGSLRVFHQDGALVGCGLDNPVVAGRDAHDLGMLVHPDHRRQGLGEHILRFLKRACLDRGQRPICGCAVDNLASRRTLERAGFVSRHALVHFTL